MFSMFEKILSSFLVDTDMASSTIAGATAEAITHPRAKKQLIARFIKTLSVGWLLATFVAPGVAAKFELSKEESVAVAFICGYSGIKILNSTEAMVLSMIKRKESDA